MIAPVRAKPIRSYTAAWPTPSPVAQEAEAAAGVEGELHHRLGECRGDAAPPVLG